MQTTFNSSLSSESSGMLFFKSHVMPAVKKPTRKKLQSLKKDMEGSAAAAHLHYVHDTDAGITRIRKGSSFAYVQAGKKVTDKATLERIEALVIPPAWEDVWICARANGHLQCTGKDGKGRKQYRYHPDWNALRNQTKFTNLLAFAAALPKIRKTVEADMQLPGLPKTKVLAAAVSIMELTGIRVGNAAYEKLYGSFGLTTLRDKHLKKDPKGLRFEFKGKKGVRQSVPLKSKKLARLVQRCKEVPGQTLFQYLDDAGERHSIDSGMVNSYIHEISGGPFSAKDFRTWTGSLTALRLLRTRNCAPSETEGQKAVLEVLDEVAAVLGNTRTVCKKYYVHPRLTDLYGAGTLHVDCDWKVAEQPGLTTDESWLVAALSRP